MITALLSPLLGIIGGIIPAGIKGLTARQQHKQEIELMKLQMELQLKAGVSRLEETQIQADASALSAAYRHDTASAKGAPTWVISVRALMRPILALLAILLSAFVVIYSFKYEPSAVPLTMLVAFSFEITTFCIAFYFSARNLSKFMSNEK